MDEELRARISPEHAVRFSWFEEHAGQVTGFPGRLDGGLLVVMRWKGIYKPKGTKYAVSIRINLGSPYHDSQVLYRPDGSWRLSYHQENEDPTARDHEYANVALMQCIDDRIPVGVLLEREAPGRRSRYEVLGLAMPVRWYDGYCFLESADTSGILRGGDLVGDVLAATAEADVEDKIRGAQVPSDEYDARLRVYRQITQRRGQREFRAALLRAYKGRCAITGFDATEALGAGGCSSSSVSRPLL